MGRTFILCAFSVFAIIASATVFNFVSVEATSGASADRKTKKDDVVSSTSSAPASGDLVVYRVGDGVAALSAAAAPVFLDEFTTGGTVVGSTAMPTAVSGSNKRLVAAGSATSEGLITRSANNKYLILSGYDADVGTASLAGTASTTVNRVIGRVDHNGNIDTTTALTDAISGGNPRGAASTNGNDLWISGSTGGAIRYATHGSTTSTSLTASPTNIRGVNIFGGQLYISSASSTFQGVSTVGTGTPTTAGQATTILPGFPTTTGPSSYQFVLFNPTTMFVCDDRAVASGGGIQKWTLSGGTWTLANTFNAGQTMGCRGLTATTNGFGQAVLYATTADTPSKLVTVRDDGTGVFTTLATAAANTAFRGVAFAPVIHKTNADFDGDGKTDFTIVRGTGSPFAGSLAASIPTFKSNRERWIFQAQHPDLVSTPSDVPAYWFTLGSAGAVTITGWGDAITDHYLAADFDGDGKDDIAVWRPGAPGVFFILRSLDNTIQVVQLGDTTSDPTVTADYDGDGKDDPAIYTCPVDTPGPCFFKYVGSLNNPSGNVTSVKWGDGVVGDVLPIPGDFDGDGKADFTIQRANPGNPSVGQFCTLRSSNMREEYTNWGTPTDFVIPGDFDGDGYADIMIMRNIGGNLVYFLLTRTGSVQIAQWGASGDEPVPGDYDGDGKTDLAVWRPSSPPNQGVFFVYHSSDGTVQIVGWGQCSTDPCDTAVANWQVH